jgi:squalene-hopene/tetraprenyl-beta-curcumene cyclase
MHPDNPTSADHAVAVDLTPLDAARHALARARDYTLGLQDAEGWWQSGFETNVTMDAEDLLLREFLGLHDDELIAATARWIRSKQRDDGTWATYFGGPGELSTTVEGYLALRLAGDEPDAPHMKQARIWILDQGGLEATRVFTRVWLALSGLWSWDDLPVIPPEMIYMPSWLPLNIYDWACWARQTIVALAVLQSFRPSRPLPFTIDELRTGVTPRRPPADPWARLFIVLDKALHRYRPVKSVRRAALRRCADWIIARQEKDGSWGGIQPPWVYSLMALNMLGYDVTHPIMAKGLAGLDQFTLFRDSPDGPMRTFDACQGPVWGTVLMMVGLADAGLPPDHPALVNAGRWVLGEEIRGPGDWQVRRPKLAPAGWSFSFENDVYPDNDDTAEVVLALRRVEPRNQAAIDRGLAWLTGMQSKDGGWGAFDADNTRKIVKKPPFCDFGEVIDPPTADVTAHVIEALAKEGLDQHPVTMRGTEWLLQAQEKDGSWFGRWGVNYVYGTGASLMALAENGAKPSDTAVRRAVKWLESHQNKDGGWGEDVRS